MSRASTANTGKSWKSQQKTLFASIKAGKTVKQIAKLLKRSESSVSQQASVSGYSFRTRGRKKVAKSTKAGRGRTRRR